MRSSTSSSERAVPGGRWLLIDLAALLVLVLFVGVVELRLDIRGIRPARIDSEWSWVGQRARASALGERALILVGASRILLDMDLDVLRRQTGLEPVQLAIDDSSFVPILENLAADPSIRGTVLVSYQDNVIESRVGEEAAAHFVSAWTRDEQAHHIPTFASTEAWLTDWLHARLRSYADGARPINSLRNRIFSARPKPQYLLTLPDRSKLADYTKVDMPAFYYGRVQRNLGEDVPIPRGATWNDLDAAIRKRIGEMPVADRSAVPERSERVAMMVKKIEARGGHVAFVALPTDGLVRLIDEKRYPRELFWDRFAETVGVKAINSRDYPSLMAFRCPDGSHLDYRDRARFTVVLTEILGLDAADGRPSL